jgi:hypothetical protein
MGIDLREQVLFDEAAFGNETHETESLLKLGPITRGQNEGEKAL